VLNPYAPSLGFPYGATRMRRDHEKYLTLIDTIALLHQHQREVKTLIRRGKPIEYIEATLADVALANDLAHDVLGRSLDELPPQTRRLLILIEHFVAQRMQEQIIERAQVRFSRRELREATAIGDTQLRLHLDRLVELEYVPVHRGGRGSSFVYELVYDGAGQDGKPFVPGLIDVAALRAIATATNLAGVKGEIAAPSRGQRGPNAAGSRGGEIAEDARKSDLSEESGSETSKPLSKEESTDAPSYTQDAAVPLAAAAPDGAAP
jgi:hypothetical protein